MMPKTLDLQSTSTWLQGSILRGDPLWVPHLKAALEEAGGGAGTPYVCVAGYSRPMEELLLLLNTSGQDKQVGPMPQKQNPGTE